MSQEACKIGDENTRLTEVVNSLEDELRSSVSAMTRLADRVEKAEGWAEETDKRLKILVNLQHPSVNLGSPMSESSTLGEEEVRALQERVRALEATAPQVGLGGSCGGSCRFTLEKEAQLTRLTNQVAALETAIKSEVVSVGQVVLKDLAAAKEFAASAGLEGDEGAFLSVAHLAIQPLYLLDLVHAVKLAPESNTVAKIKNQQTVGMTDFEAIAAKSISNLIPALFGNGLKADELSEIPTYESFNEPGTVHGSLLDQVTSGIGEVEAAINQQIEDAQVEARAKLMLSSCLLESKLFVLELFTFMRRFHERYSPALPPKEVWSILQYLVRAGIADL